MRSFKPTTNEQKQSQIDSAINSKANKIYSFIILFVIIILLSGLYLRLGWNRYIDIDSDEATPFIEFKDHTDDNLKTVLVIISDIIISMCIFILCLAIIYIKIQNSTLKSLYRKLSFSEALYRNIFSQAPIGIAIMNEKHFTSQSKIGEANINPMFKKIIGCSAKDLETKTWADIIHPDDLQAGIEKLNKFKKGEINCYSMEKRFIKPDGSVVWTNIKLSPLTGLPDKQPMYMCLLEDITIRMATPAALNESERSKSVFLSHLPGLAYRCNYDPEWTMQYVSIGCFELTGYPAESLLYNRDLSFNSIIAPEYRDILYKEWMRIIENRLPFKYEYEIITASNERKWVLEMGQPIYNDKGEVEALEGIVLDISDRKKIENDLIYINEHDSLTGLYNRRVLEKFLISDAEKFRTAKRAVIGINLSAVQALTKTYGFQYTQKLIKKAADVLRQFCSDHRLLFNTYGDNFVFYLREYENKDELIPFCECISNALNQLLRTERISGGIGIVEIEPNQDLDIDLLLKKLLIASEKSINHPSVDFYPYFYDAYIESEIVRQDDIKRTL